MSCNANGSAISRYATCSGELDSRDQKLLTVGDVVRYIEDRAQG